MDAVLPKKKGPLAQGYVDTHLRIEPHLLEWLRQQPGGFSACVRKLVRDAYEREQRRRVNGS